MKKADSKKRISFQPDQETAKALSVLQKISPRLTLSEVIRQAVIDRAEQIRLSESLARLDKGERVEQGK